MEKIKRFLLKLGGGTWSMILVSFSICILLFKFYDFIIANGKEIGVSAIGAYLGFVGAAAIYLFQLDNEKSKSNRETLQRHKEHLRYFAGAMDDVIRYAKNQAESLSEIEAAIKAHPSTIHQLAFVASDAIGRLNRADNEAAFHAYNTLFAKNPERENDYRSILSKTDFLTAQLAAVKQLFIDYRDGLYKRQLKLKDIIQTIADEAAFLLNELRQPEPAYTFAKYAPHATEELNSLVLDYVELNSKLVPFEVYFEKFVEPLKLWLNSNKDYFPFKHPSYQKRENLVRLTKGASVSFADLLYNAREFVPAFNPARLRDPALEIEQIVNPLKTAAAA